jgi:hypothetical protein
MVKRQRREFAAGFCQQVKHLVYQQERVPFGFLSEPYQIRIAMETSPLPGSVGLLISTIPPPLAVVGFSGVCLV